MAAAAAAAADPIRRVGARRVLVQVWVHTRGDQYCVIQDEPGDEFGEIEVGMWVARKLDTRCRISHDPTV